MKARFYPAGMTVKQLKELVATWPDTNDEGEFCEVWIGTRDGLSSPAVSVWPLNKRGEAADFLIEPSAV